LKKSEAKASDRGEVNIRTPQGPALNQPHKGVQCSGLYPIPRRRAQRLNAGQGFLYRSKALRPKVGAWEKQAGQQQPNGGWFEFFAVGGIKNHVSAFIVAFVTQCKAWGLKQTIKRTIFSAKGHSAGKKDRAQRACMIKKFIIVTGDTECS
jgi:hypothetical protein